MSSLRRGRRASGFYGHNLRHFLRFLGGQCPHVSLLSRISAVCALWIVVPFSCRWSLHWGTRGSHWRSVERMRVSRILKVESNLSWMSVQRFLSYTDTVVFGLNRWVLWPELSWLLNELPHSSVQRVCFTTWGGEHTSRKKVVRCTIVCAQFVEQSDLENGIKTYVLIHSTQHLPVCGLLTSVDPRTSAPLEYSLRKSQELCLDCRDHYFARWVFQKQHVRLPLSTTLRRSYVRSWLDSPWSSCRAIWKKERTKFPRLKESSRRSHFQTRSNRTDPSSTSHTRRRRNLSFILLASTAGSLILLSRRSSS